jgi:hypothetical protein
MATMWQEASTPTPRHAAHACLVVMQGAALPASHAGLANRWWACAEALKDFHVAGEALFWSGKSLLQCFPFCTHEGG